jgi:tetrapyrrole methylase family protein/MazG family protein
MNFELKETYNIDDLVRIVALLRSPEGCPWDKIQTHKSIKSDLIEECYEAVEAIDTDDPVLLREELGDVLLQVVFHAGIETDADHFTFDDVANDICRKLIHRHPHVFGEVIADTPDEVLKNWDAIKKTEKKQETAEDTLRAVSKALPALMRGEKIIKRAYRAGYSNTPETVIEKIIKTAENLKDLRDFDKNSNLMGEILLNLCEFSFLTKKNAEQDLTDASERFIMYFGQNKT